LVAKVVIYSNNLEKDSRLGLNSPLPLAKFSLYVSYEFYSGSDQYGISVIIYKKNYGEKNLKEPN